MWCGDFFYLICVVGEVVGVVVVCWIGVVCVVVGIGGGGGLLLVRCFFIVLSLVCSCFIFLCKVWFFVLLSGVVCVCGIMFVRLSVVVLVRVIL